MGLLHVGGLMCPPFDEDNMTELDLYNAREQLADVAEWLGWQDECLAFGLVNAYDALRLYDLAPVSCSS